MAASLRAVWDAEYLAVPYETRLEFRRKALANAEAKVERLNRELDIPSAARLARRDLPAARKELARCERELTETIEENQPQEAGPVATEYAKIFHELSEPFTHEVKSKPPRGEKYVTARAVMNRLDKIVGPENWWDDYSQTQNGVICKLTIRLPDGREITKVDAGGHAGMPDGGDDEKSGFSDAFKRAAVKFGVGRHLYGDGIPLFVEETADDYAGPKSKAEFAAYLKSIDPTLKSGPFDALMEWATAKPRAYPEKINGWTPDQIREGYIYISDKLAKESK